MHKVEIRDHPYRVEGYRGTERVSVPCGLYFAYPKDCIHPDYDEPTRGIWLLDADPEGGDLLVVMMDYPDLDDWPALPAGSPFLRVP